MPITVSTEHRRRIGAAALVTLALLALAVGARPGVINGADLLAALLIITALRVVLVRRAMDSDELVLH